MGIPTFFRILIEKTRTSKQTLLFSKDDMKHRTDYFFIDFNAILYTVWNESSSKHENIQTYLIQDVINKLRHLIENVVCPNKNTVIAMDGVAPIAKIIQQRQRRIKSLKTHHYLSNNKSSSWDLSCHACPGTRFMKSMANEIRKYIKNSNIILSDSLSRGEGEHKILHYIRTLYEKEPLSYITVFSPDNDLISLLLLTKKKNMSILRFTLDESNEYEKPFIQDGVYFISIDNIQQLIKQSYFQNDITDNWIYDYNFLLFMVGNDFIPSLPFMKIRSKGLDLLLSIYQDIQYNFKYSSLIYKEDVHWKINISFFKKIIHELSIREKHLMKKHHDSLLESFSGHIPTYHYKSLQKLSPQDQYKNIFEHVSIFNPLHPLCSQYSYQLKSIHFNYLSADKWKDEYYKMFSGHYPLIKYKMVEKYIQSLLFTLSYYLDECPSWTWGYTYDIAPLFSDIKNVLENNEQLLSSFSKDINNLSYKEQLAIIIPHEQQMNIFPMTFVKKLRKCPRYNTYFPYHKDVILNAWHGNKYIYAETILSPIFEDKEVMDYIHQICLDN